MFRGKTTRFLRCRKYSISFFVSLFIYFEREREREREHICKQGRGRERGRERIPSRLHAVSAQPEKEAPSHKW